MKKALSTLAFSMSSVISSPAPFSNGPVFSLLFLFLTCRMLISLHTPCQTQLQVILGFPNPILARSDSKFVFLLVTGPQLHLFYTSFFCLSSVSISLLIHASFPQPLLDFLLIRKIQTYQALQVEDSALDLHPKFGPCFQSTIPN